MTRYPSKPSKAAKLIAKKVRRNQPSSRRLFLFFPNFSFSGEETPDHLPPTPTGFAGRRS